MADSEQLAVIKQALFDILEHDPDTLGTDPGLGEISFGSSQQEFQQINTFAQELKDLPFEELPTGGINWAQLAKSLGNLSATLQEISKFEIGDRPNPKSERDALVGKLASQADASLAAFLPYIPYLTLRSAQVHEVVRQSKTLLETTEADCEKALTHVNGQKETIDQVVRAAMDAASKIGVAKFATNFDNIAGDHDISSDNWLKTAAGFGVVTLVITGFFVWQGPIWPLKEIPADTSVFPYVLSKIVFVSFLYFVSLWAAKNYKAHRHLAVLNRHRQNSLSTFETFVEATNDQQTKNAVLLEATHCIFTPGTTGYLGKEPEPPTSRVVEIIKSVGSASE